MKKIPVEDAIGETICHDMTAIMENGYKGAKFKRGHVIAEGDIPALLDMGKTQIYVWEPEADEVHEEDAARELSMEICGSNLAVSGPSEGKFQISAATDGLFRVNGGALRKINSVEDYTVVCRPGGTRVSRGDTLAGLRIVPLVTKRSNVDEAVAIAKENFPVFAVMPFRPLKTSIIITGSEIFNGRIPDKFEPILRRKLGAFGAEIVDAVKCPDDLETLQSAVDNSIGSGAQLILMTGGMSVDPDDLTPTAIKRTGARMVTQGVPMQPGNMLTMAYLGQTMLIGVPGASMHSPVTSLDVFLPRIFAGIEIEKGDIAGLGEGGLCLGCKECTYPVCYFGN